ncbi:hypothetical protein FQN54_002281 [Arachnomyces sp. PD_36]|nr:hypothetical protein FQN54_002281 [Arachnomyces sp. PD_36]
MPLLELPETLLEDIIALATGVVPSTSALRYNRTFHLEDSLTAKKKGPTRRRSGGSSTAMSLLLSSRLLSTLTRGILLRRGVFSPRSGEAMEEFLGLIGEDAFQLVKHVNWTVYMIEPPDSDICASNVLGRGELTADIVERLPSKLNLHSLRLRPQEGAQLVNENSIFSGVGSMFCPEPTDAFKRFRDLRELELDFPMYAHFEIFWAGSLSGGGGLGLEAPSNGPAFPALRRLLLRGRSNTNLFEARIIQAFSEGQLPSLQTLQIHGVVGRYSPEGERASRIPPELLRAVHPLSEFEWIGFRCPDFCVEGKHTLQGRLSRAHLEALKERHGETLRSLTIDYGTCGCAHYCPPEFDFTKEELMEFLLKLPALEWVSIKAPQIDFQVEGERCRDETD